LAEVIRQAAAIREEHSAEAARERISLLLAEEPAPASVASVILQVLGLAEGTAPSADIAWASRKLLEALAKERPRLVCLDDLQWAEPALIDLIDGMVARSRAVPILVLGLARPEFLGRRPAWASVRLGPLPRSDAARLVARLADLGEDARARVIAR